jgi:hypothetical protein
MRLIGQAMLLRRYPVKAKLRELAATIAPLLPDAWRRLRGRVPAQNIPEQAVQQQAAATQIELAQVSLIQITVHHMRLEGMLHKLTGDGEVDEQDLEAEWQHKLETSPNWQKATDHMADHEKKRYFEGERRAFVEGTHNALARAQAKLEAQAKPKPGDLDLAEVLARFQHDRLRELDGCPPELPQDLPQEVPEMFVQHAITQKEYEALAFAIFQQNRMHRDSPDAVEATSYQVLSKEKYEALALAVVEAKRKYLQTKKHLRRKEQRRRKNEEKGSKRKELEAAGEKPDAKREKIKSEKEARKALKARRALEEGWLCEARIIEDRARATRLAQAKATFVS